MGVGLGLDHRGEAALDRGLHRRHERHDLVVDAGVGAHDAHLDDETAQEFRFGHVEVVGCGGVGVRAAVDGQLEAAGDGTGRVEACGVDRALQVDLGVDVAGEGVDPVLLRLAEAVHGDGPEGAAVVEMGQSGRVGSVLVVGRAEEAVDAGVSERRVDRAVRSRLRGAGIGGDGLAVDVVAGGLHHVRVGRICGQGDGTEVRGDDGPVDAGRARGRDVHLSRRSADFVHVEAVNGDLLVAGRVEVELRQRRHGVALEVLGPEEHAVLGAGLQTSDVDAVDGRRLGEDRARLRHTIVVGDEAAVEGTRVLVDLVAQHETGRDAGAAAGERDLVLREQTVPTVVAGVVEGSVRADTRVPHLVAVDLGGTGRAPDGVRQVVRRRGDRLERGLVVGTTHGGCARVRVADEVRVGVRAERRGGTGPHDEDTDALLVEAEVEDLVGVRCVRGVQTRCDDGGGLVGVGRAETERGVGVVTGLCEVAAVLVHHDAEATVVRVGLQVLDADSLVVTGLVREVVVRDVAELADLLAGATETEVHALERRRVPATGGAGEADAELASGDGVGEEGVRHGAAVEGELTGARETEAEVEALGGETAEAAGAELDVPAGRAGAEVVVAGVAVEVEATELEHAQDLGAGGVLSRVDDGLEGAREGRLASAAELRPHDGGGASGDGESCLARLFRSDDVTEAGGGANGGSGLVVEHGHDAAVGGVAGPDHEAVLRAGQQVRHRELHIRGVVLAGGGRLFEQVRRGVSGRGGRFAYHVVGRGSGVGLVLQVEEGHGAGNRRGLHVHGDEVVVHLGRVEQRTRKGDGRGRHVDLERRVPVRGNVVVDRGSRGHRGTVVACGVDGLADHLEVLGVVHAVEFPHLLCVHVRQERERHLGDTGRLGLEVVRGGGRNGGGAGPHDLVEETILEGHRRVGQPGRDAGDVAVGAVHVGQHTDAVDGGGL
eukprot:PhM_4_TR1246/c1_g1_i1/m.28355